MRQAPCEKPRRTTRCAGTVFSIIFSRRASMSRAALRYGSLLSMDAVKGFGYHALPAACGAR